MKTTSAPLYLPLEAEEATLSTVGGKGASLAKVAAAGLPVPTGFHLTTEAYRRFIAANDLQEEIMGFLSDIKDDPTSLEQVSESIQALFSGSNMPEEVIAAIYQAYDRLGTGEPAVAVRSSATAEDLPERSFAGQQETYLNVKGREELLAAVHRCWASLWTARAIGYRNRAGIAQELVEMGVVVQLMIPAETAGVIFTANPNTGERNELVVSAGFGLGEAVVSGQITPDTYVLDRTDFTLKKTSLGNKERMIIPAAGQGTVTQTVPAEKQREQALLPSRLRELADLALQVEDLFGEVPQDIEWAVAGGRCWLLQARPITGLPPASLKDVRWEPPEAGSKWIRRQVVENMPDPLSPLFGDLYLKYLDESVEVMQETMGFPRFMKKVIHGLFDKPIFATIHGYAYMRGSANIRWWSAPLVIPCVLAAMALGVTKLFRGEGIKYWKDDALPTYLETIERWKALKPADASDEQLLRGVRELTRADARYWFAAALAAGTAKSSDMLLNTFLTYFARGRKLDSSLFLRGFPSKILDAGVELEAIAEYIRGFEELRELFASTPSQQLMNAIEKRPEGRRVLKKLHTYLERYGQQIYSLDFAEPTQAEDPLPVLLSLQTLLRKASGPTHDRQVKMARERDELADKVARSFGPVRRRLFRQLLRQAQRFAPYREEALFYIGGGWPVLRRLALELGRRLVKAGTFRSPDDVFFLRSAELDEACAARAKSLGSPKFISLANERRKLREARKRLHPPASVPITDGWRVGPFNLSGRMSQRQNEPQGFTLHGFAVSSGKVTAPASVILSPADFPKMVPGNILVCPSTTPAWTPLFTQAQGLVTDIGGIAAHGSIVVREYGIPAVMGTGIATQRITEGQLITVDGNTGTVTLDEKETTNNA